MSTLICKNDDDVKALLDFIAKEEILAYDTETNSLNVHTGLVIGVGISNDKHGYYLPLYSFQVDTATLAPCPMGIQSIQRVLQALTAKKLIMHNASFDIRFTKNALGIDLLPALYADTMLMKHTCDENFPFGLKEIATKLWGADVTKEKEAMQASIKANGGTSTQYYKADTELIGVYCAQDCLLTFRVFNYYLRDLARQQLTDFYFSTEVMALYKYVTIPMESQGVKLNIELMKATLYDIGQDIINLEIKIQNAIAPFLGSVFTPWLLNKDYPLQTPTGKMPKWAQQGLTQQQAWERDNNHYPCYMFNLNSDFHIRKLFFDTLKEKAISFTDKKKQPQADEEFLMLMAKKYTWAKELIVYNKLQKLRSTYIEQYLEKAHNGRVYPDFKQHGTVSGRYSGDLQQLPRPLDEDEALEPIVAKYTSLIRSFFIADDGCHLVSADYNQLEPSIFAHTSGDPALQNIFKSGHDFYSTVAINTEGLQGVSADKEAPNYLGKLNKTARQKAKTYSLGIAYGMTGFKLKFEIGVSDREADALVQKYLTAFPALAAWMLDSKEQVKNTGRIATQAGRVRHMPRAAQLFKKYGSVIDDDLQLWKAFHESAIYDQAKKDRREYKKLLNNSINFQVQGLAASIVSKASIALALRFKAESIPATIVISVHDEIVINCPDAYLAVASNMMKETMENVVQLDVPLKATPIAGKHFGECK